VPTLLVFEGFRFFFYSREGNEPAHVHVEKGGGEAKFWLGPVSLDWAAGLKAQELSRAEAVVVRNRERFLRAWDEYFGKTTEK
jgi:hypothetical protein